VTSQHNRVTEHACSTRMTTAIPTALSMAKKNVEMGSTARKRLTDLIRRDVKALSPGASIREAAMQMKLHEVGFAPVECQQTGLVLGILTHRDIVSRMLTSMSNPNIDETRVADIMTHDVVSVLESEFSIESVSNLMRRHKVRHVVVLDDSGWRLVGVLSLADLRCGCDRDLLAPHIQPSKSRTVHFISRKAATYVPGSLIPTTPIC